MKKTEMLHCLFTVPLLVVVSGMLFLSACSRPDVIDAYDYPVKPGTEEWKSFFTHQEMIDACQIPEDVLTKMSTKGLVETVVNYPLLVDMSAHNFAQDGVDAVASYFNGLAELFSRKDAGAELLAKYRSMGSTDIQDGWTDVEKGNYMFKIRAIEMLLAQEPVLVNMSTAERRALLEECRNKYKETKQHPELFSRFSLEPTAWVMGRALQQENYAPFIQKITQDNNLGNFLGWGNFSQDPVLDEIFFQIASFLGLN
jgi:hypothetical protein